MSFLNNINQSSINVKKAFSVEEFNANFLKHQQEIQHLKRNQLQQRQQIVRNEFMDPRFNYTDPHAPNYINPNMDSPNRAACLLVVDRHRKKFLSVFKVQGSYDIPGGKTKIIEPYEDAAIRELYEETGIVVDKHNMTKILEASDRNFNVVTFVAFVHRGRIETKEDHLVGWVPLKYLNFNNNPRWQKYNQLVFEKVLSMMY